MAAPHYLNSLVTKNKLTRGCESILVTYHNIYSKCYLKLFKIVPEEMGSY